MSTILKIVLISCGVGIIGGAVFFIFKIIGRKSASVVNDSTKVESIEVGDSDKPEGLNNNIKRVQ